MIDTILYYLIEIRAIIHFLWPLVAMILFIGAMFIIIRLWLMMLAIVPEPEPVYSDKVKVKYGPFWTKVIS